MRPIPARAGCLPALVLPCCAANARARAGVMTSVYSTPGRMVRLATGVMLEKTLPGNGAYPRHFHVSSSPDRTRAFDITLPDARQTEQQAAP